MEHNGASQADATAGAAEQSSERPSIYHGECSSILAELPAESVDLVVTDPPYVARYRDRFGRAVANDSRADWIEPAFRAIHRVLKADTLCVSFYGWQHVERFMLAWKAAGFFPVGHLVWPKAYASRTGFLGAHHEQAYLLAKGYPRKPAPPLPDVLPWVYSGNVEHPTQKAVEIIEPLVATFSQPGDVVLDPFLGSGTTGVAAVRLGRRFIGVEMEAQHFKTAVRRIDAAWLAAREAIEPAAR